MIHEITSVAELGRSCDDDPLVLWTAQGLDGRARAWRSGDAVAVAVSDLARHDRIAVTGPPDDVAALLREVFDEIGPAYKPFGDEALIRKLPERLAGLTFRATFGWMDTRTPTGAGSNARWIDDDAAVSDLLAIASPGSYAQPGMRGVTRWAAVAGGNRLLSVAGDAWSTPGVGFIAGVATVPQARGRGLSYAVCGFVTDELLREHGLSTLMVDTGNQAGIALYQKLGYVYRGVAAAAMSS